MGEANVKYLETKTNIESNSTKKVTVLKFSIMLLIYQNRFLFKTAL